MDIVQLGALLSTLVLVTTIWLCEKADTDSII